MANNFGEFLRQKRQEKNLTQKELSNLLFVSASAVSKWEKGVSHPDITLLPKLCEILSVTEHELITASVDNKKREEETQAKKWRVLSFSWSLFFYIAYPTALLPCFICNLAIDKTLSWFWIVFFALLFSFTFTNLPKLIKKYKLVLIPLCNYLALCLLLGVCCVYTKGGWFWISILSVLLGLVIIFLPIYISKYPVFSKVKKYNDVISILVDFIILNVLLLVINCFTIKNGYSNNWWFFTIAIPITFIIFLELNILLSIRFLKINKCLKTSIILFLSNLFLYLPPLFIKSKSPETQNEIDDVNIFKANLSCWQVDKTLEQNIHLIIFLTVLFLAVIFLIIGAISNTKKKN